ncbi:ABC transporter permease [Paradesulfitobacterium aromaticivorans]
MPLQIWLGTLEQGLMYALMVLGVYLTFRVLDYADLSVDGSFTLGAAIAAILISSGYNPWAATALAFIGGLLAGIFTGVLHTKFNITPLLSGILTMTALYSVNLRVMGKANISLLRTRTIFTDFEKLPFMGTHGVLALTLITVIIVGIVIYLFLETEIGLALRATGDNEMMIKSQGVNTDVMKILGLALSNGLVAFAGSYVAQNQQFADVGMGIGMIIAGLASVIIGEVLIGTSTILRTIIAVIVGGVLYRVIIAVVLQLGLKPTDLKLVTALIVIFALISPALKKKFKARNPVASGKGEN